MFINRNILNIYNIILNFLAYEIINDINISNISIKLRVLCESDYALIIIESYNNYEIKIIQSQKLIKIFFN